jgi:uroporphyrinogen decarboxylase
MTMSSYEVVRRAIEFEYPERVPLIFDKFGKDDTKFTAPNQIYPWENQDTPENLDEWGCLWVRSEMDNMGYCLGHPLAEWSSLDHYHWPDPDDPGFYDGMEAKLTDSEGKYIRTGLLITLFERMRFLHGFEETLTDFYLEREKMERLADRILEYDMQVVENIHQRFPDVIHGVNFTDDWGTQQGLMVHPDLWREFFKPRYKRLFDKVHEYNWHVWLHSCGKVNVIIEDLIEIGLNVISLEQPRALGIEEIGKQYSGRICFAGPCDIQHTLPLHDPEAIKAEAKLLIQCWGTRSGGFIAQDKSDVDAYGGSIENSRIMMNAFIKADRWKNRQ